MSKSKANNKKKSMAESAYGYLFIAPNLLGMLVFVIVPIFTSLLMSFTDWDLINAPRWVGLSNFTDKMVHDQQFWVSLKNTFVFSLLTIPLGIAAAFVIALLLNQSIKGVNLYRAAIFLPVGISMISISVIWRWILNTDLGILNYVLSLVNLQGAGWLSDEKYALFSVSAISIWKSVGFNMVILLAGLKGVPSHLYEAATIDGAGAWRRMTRITLPLITPSLFFVSIMSVIGSFQVFDLIYSTTSGGPGDSTRVIYYWVYQNGFKFFEMGYASALAWVVFIMLFAVTLLQMKFFGNKVNYEMD
ncbi:carbohydrate ABC transporter permease [Cohnella phaseoli]|uniref:Carbohydrate ABC transporter membrane protein 1 (CUT1 family) n=1 Tax=Cohnella phaseoli TaxID=456490 RepID=A0A3D9IJH1_9BACL|nr:sugar ABC transporter permease [Cohnella phaseoli]RED61910.1 carbohydrate ABC transporter membrane protein 1 (CUT1 family) [Cohnella phaseoli]